MSLPDNTIAWAMDNGRLTCRPGYFIFYANAKLSGSLDVANDNEILSMF